MTNPNNRNSTPAQSNPFTDPEIIGCMQDAQEILAFNLPESERQAFRLFIDFITSPEPTFISQWRASPDTVKWYGALVDGLGWATPNAYACVEYHFQKLADLEAKVLEKLSKRDYKKALADRSVAFGNTLVWDFEYQAFVFAYRRCLDYLTRGLAAFFKHDFHSFSSMPRKLRTLKPANVASALVEIHGKHCSNFAFVMSEGKRRSVRDKMAHYEWVQAGTINLTPQGFVLGRVGESQHAASIMEFDKAALTEALGARVRMLKACIDEMLTVFVTEVRSWEARRRSSDNP